jgi:hypothetical protein
MQLAICDRAGPPRLTNAKAPSRPLAEPVACLGCCLVGAGFFSSCAAAYLKCGCLDTASSYKVSVRSLRGSGPARPNSRNGRG